MDKNVMHSYNTCPNCGKTVSQNNKICPSCKYDLFTKYQQEKKESAKQVENFQVFRLTSISLVITVLLNYLGHIKDFQSSIISILIFFLMLLFSITISVFIVTIFTKKMIPFRIIIYYWLTFSFLLFLKKIFHISITQFFIILGFIMHINIILLLSWLFINIIPIAIYTKINDQIKNNPKRQKVLKSITITIVTSITLFFGVSIFLFHQYFTGLSDFYSGKEVLHTIKANEALAYKNKGLERYKENDYKGALKDFNESIRLNSKDAETYINRAIVNKDLQNFDEAIADYETAKKLDQKLVLKYPRIDLQINSYRKKAETYINKAIVNKDLQNFDEAIADYETAINLNKKLVKKHPRIDLQIKSYRKKLEKYNKLIKLEPDNVSAYEKRAEIKFEIKNYTGAIEDYTQAIKIQKAFLDKFDAKTFNKNNPNRINLHPKYITFLQTISLAHLYHDRGVAESQLLQYKEAIEDHTQAINILDDAVEKYPTGKYTEKNFYYDLYNSRAISKTNTGDYNGALEDYNKLLEIDPDKKRDIEKKINKIKFNTLINNIF